MSGTKSIPITVGAKGVLGHGNFYQILDSSAPLTVRATKGGGMLHEAVDVVAGYAAEFPDGFDRLELTSATAQTVKVDVSTMRSGYAARVSGDVDATVVNVPSVRFSQGTVVTESSVTCAAANQQYNVVAADAARRVVRFYNPSTNTGEMAIYASDGLPRANAVIHILPGGFVSESDAAGITWWVRAEVAGETLKVQTIS